MKAKLFGKLKQAYSSLGLGDEILQARAESLAAMGLVTDDNIDFIVSTQKNDLEGLQRLTDTRVTNAQKKEREKAEADKKAKEEETQAAARKAEEAHKKEIEELKAKLAEKKEPTPTPAPKPEPTKTESEPMPNKHTDINFSEMLAEYERRQAEQRTLEKELARKQAEENQLKFEAAIEELRAKQAGYLDDITKLREANDALRTQHEAIEKERQQQKAAEALLARQNMILSKAKELEIPQWRIDEGFNIADDAADDVVSATLSQVANNIRTNLLPSNKAAMLASGNNPTKEEVAEIAKSIVK